MNEELPEDRFNRVKKIMEEEMARLKEERQAAAQTKETGTVLIGASGVPDGISTAL